MDILIQEDMPPQGTLFPRDDEPRRIGTKAEAIFHYKIDPAYWVYRTQSNIDRGTDIVLELVEDGEFRNHRILCQIKGTKNPQRLKDETTLTFPLDVRTINYALSGHEPFLLVVCDVSEEVKEAYYLPIQEYFINNQELFTKTTSGQKTINLHIPIENSIFQNDQPLRDLARVSYIGGPGNELRRAR